MQENDDFYDELEKRLLKKENYKDYLIITNLYLQQVNSTFKNKALLDYINLFYRILTLIYNSLNINEDFDEVKIHLVKNPEISRNYYKFIDGYLYENVVNLDNIDNDFIALSKNFLDLAKQMISNIKKYNLNTFIDISISVLEKITNSFDFNEDLTSSMYLELNLLAKLKDYLNLIYNNVISIIVI